MQASANAEEVALLHEVNAGNLDNLQCPKCQHKTVSAWFTHPEPETFRTYLICADCDFWSPVINFRVVGLNSNPHAIPLFQSCDDPPRKVLAFVLAAMSVKVHDLSPTTELHIHTAFSSALACELRRRPLLRIIYRVDPHWRFTSTYPTMLRVIILPPRASSQAGS